MVLGEDADTGTLPRNARPFNRVQEAIAEQLIARGFRVDELIALVKPMSADNCEQYARAILGRIGGPSFEQLIRRIVETAVNDGGRPPSFSIATWGNRSLTAK
jgi:hypothetical protein